MGSLQLTILCDAVCRDVIVGESSIRDTAFESDPSDFSHCRHR